MSFMFCFVLLLPKWLKFILLILYLYCNIVIKNVKCLVWPTLSIYFLIVITWWRCVSWCQTCNRCNRWMFHWSRYQWRRWEQKCRDWSHSPQTSTFWITSEEDNYKICSNKLFFFTTLHLYKCMYLWNEPRWK